MFLKTYHNQSLIEIIGKLIQSNITPCLSEITENGKISFFRLPDELSNICTYGNLFQVLTTLDSPIIPIGRNYIIKKIIE